jgi:hypothetical protein
MRTEYVAPVAEEGTEITAICKLPDARGSIAAFRGYL